MRGKSLRPLEGVTKFQTLSKPNQGPYSEDLVFVLWVLMLFKDRKVQSGSQQIWMILLVDIWVCGLPWTQAFQCNVLSALKDSGLKYKRKTSWIPKMKWFLKGKKQRSLEKNESWKHVGKINPGVCGVGHISLCALDKEELMSCSASWFLWYRISHCS